MHKLAPENAVDTLPSDQVLRRIRVPLIQRARVDHKGGREDLFLIDIGLHGAFVERSEPLPVGTDVDISFLLPGNELPILARARVAWWNPPGELLVSKTLPSGLGLHFVEVGERGVERIRDFLQEYLGRDPRNRRFIRQPEAALEEDV